MLTFLPLRDIILFVPGALAQLVEHIVHIDGVTGSSPVSTTTSSAELRIFSGALAQLVARLNGIQKVRGSTPLSSTKLNLSEPFGRKLQGSDYAIQNIYTLKKLAVLS